VCQDPYSADRSGRSNDYQIMILGSRVVGEELAKMLVDIWLGADFQGGRSTSKVERIKEIEQDFLNNESH